MTDPLAATTQTIREEVMGQSWEYAGAETQYLTHNVHRYSGKFIPQIAARVISLLTQPGELVVDPYCGSGTTLLESAVLGRRAFGLDLNPLAVLIARVKTTPISEATLNTLSGSLSNAITTSGFDSNLHLFREREEALGPDGDPRFCCEWYRKWFQPHVLRELLAIDMAISEVDGRAARALARVSFSNILRRSSNAHSGYPNVMYDKRVPSKGSPIPLFLKILKRNVEMVTSLSSISVSWTDVTVARGNASALPIASDTVDALVTHPPYIGSVPYAEYGSLSLQWLGYDSKKLDRQLTGGRRQSRNVIERFEKDYRQMLKETCRVLRPGRYAFLMVGNPIVRGEIVNLAEMTINLAHDAGLELTVHAERQGVNRRANNMGAEHLLFFRKPTLKMRKT